MSATAMFNDIWAGLVPAVVKRWRRHGDPLGGSTARGAALRYLTDVVLLHVGDACLRWPFAYTGDGIPSIGWKGRTTSVARLVCEQQNGPPASPDLDSCHNCGNGHEGCVNRFHLRWDTRAGNVADRLVHGTDQNGSKNHHAKLTETSVAAILVRHGQGEREADLARAFGVAPPTINAILHNRRWKHVDRSQQGVS